MTMLKTKLLPILILTIILSIQLAHGLSLRSNHQQMQTFANIINSAGVIPDTNSPTSTSTSDTTTQKPSSGPKIAAGIIIPIICVGLCLVFCFFCLKCAKNEQDQAERGLEETIPCYCGPMKLLCKCCKYVLCADIVLRCLGFRSTGWEKEERKRIQEEEERKRKQEKDKLKWEKKYGNQPPTNQSNPYQTQMQRQDLQPSPATNWTQSTSPSDTQKLTHQPCQLCHKKNPNILCTCSNHCVFHLQCLIDYKNSNKMSKTSNLCPACQSQYYNMVRFYCQKCHAKYSEIQIQSNNVYASQLDWKEAVKSIGGERCDQCTKKKWFWQ